MKKQTAVDILYKFLYEMESFEGFDPYDFNQEEVFAKAKAMEKEQIIEAIKLTIEKEYYEQTWAHCGSRNHMAEQYYNETFKSE